MNEIREHVSWEARCAAQKKDFPSVAPTVKKLTPPAGPAPEAKLRAHCGQIAKNNIP